MGQGRANAATEASVTPQGAQGRGGTLETFQTQVRDQDCLAPHTEHLRCGLSLGRFRTVTEGGSQGASSQQPPVGLGASASLVTPGTWGRRASEDCCDHVLA